MQKRFYLYKQNSINKNFYTTDELIIKGIKKSRRLNIYAELFGGLTLISSISTFIFPFIFNMYFVLVCLGVMFFCFFTCFYLSNQSDELYEKCIMKYRKSNEYKKLYSKYKKEEKDNYYQFALTDIIDVLELRGFKVLNTNDYLISDCGYGDLTDIFAQVLIVNENEYKIIYVSEDGQQETSVLIKYEEI